MCACVCVCAMCLICGPKLWLCPRIRFTTVGRRIFSPVELHLSSTFEQSYCWHKKCFCCNVSYHLKIEVQTSEPIALAYMNYNKYISIQTHTMDGDTRATMTRALARITHTHNNVDSTDATGKHNTMVYAVVQNNVESTVTGRLTISKSTSHTNWWWRMES